MSVDNKLISGVLKFKLVRRFESETFRGVENIFLKECNIIEVIFEYFFYRDFRQKTEKPPGM